MTPRVLWIMVLCAALFAISVSPPVHASEPGPEPNITSTTAPGEVQIGGIIEYTQGSASDEGDSTAKKDDQAKKIFTNDPDPWLIVDDLTVPVAQRAVKSRVKTPGLTEIRPDRFVLACLAGDPCDPAFEAAPDTVVIPGTPAVRISDVASFSPDAPTQQMQPNGWMVTGLATNFVARASAHELAGELLGQPADVRFTPIGYEWDYGDGATGFSAGGGATWQRLNVPEFSDTDTSHTYETTGEYAITPSVTYAAEYRYAGSVWLPVEGTVTIPGTPTTATAWIIRTALVAKNCIEDPDGIGCYTKSDPTPRE